MAPLRLVTDEADPRDQIRAEIRLNCDERMRQIVGLVHEAYTPARKAIALAEQAWHAAQAALEETDRNEKPDDHALRAAVAGDARQAMDALIAWCSGRERVLELIGFFEQPLAEDYEEPDLAALQAAERGSMRQPKEGTLAFRVRVIGGRTTFRRAGVEFSSTEARTVNRKDLTAAQVLELLNTPTLYVEELTTEASESEAASVPRAPRPTKAQAKVRGAELVRSFLLAELHQVRLGAPAYLLDGNDALVMRSEHARKVIKLGAQARALRDAATLVARAILEVAKPTEEVAVALTACVWPEMNGRGQQWVDRVDDLHGHLKLMKTMMGPR